VNAILLMQAKMHGLPSADFHKTQEILTALRADVLCRISTKLDSKCGKCGWKLIDTFQ
jgi:hypothetical protein